MSGYSKQCMARKSIMCALTRAQAQIDRLTKERDEARQEGTAAGCVVAINVMRADRDRAERERDEARATIEELSVLLEDYKKRVEQDVKEINRLKGLESVCHCGALISDHTQSDNHVFVAVVERCPNAKRLEQAVALLDKALTDLERARKGTT